MEEIMENPKMKIRRGEEEGKNSKEWREIFLVVKMHYAFLVAHAWF